MWLTTPPLWDIKGWGVFCLVGLGVPQLLHAGSKFGLGGGVLGMPNLRVVEFFRHILLEDKVSGEIVGILIVLPIAQLLHQFGGCIAQMQWHRGIARLLNQC